MSLTTTSAFRPASLFIIFILSVVVVLSGRFFPDPGYSPGDRSPEEEAAASATMLDDIVVTRPKSGNNCLQDVPVAVTAFDAEQLDALKVRDLTNLSIRMPNVSLDDAGTGNAGLRTSPFAGWALTVRFRVSIRRSVSSSTVCIWDQMRRCCTTPSTWRRSEVLRGPAGCAVRPQRRWRRGPAQHQKRRLIATKPRCAARWKAGARRPNVYVAGTLNAPLTETLGARFTRVFQSGSGLVRK